LYTIDRGNVEGYAGGQKSIVYLVTTVEKATALGQAWCFTEGHAEIAYSEYFDDLAHLEQLDWPLMRATMWGGDDERRRKRQAEFLIHETLPVSALEQIVTMNTDLQTQARYFLQRAGINLPVNVDSTWYY